MSNPHPAVRPLGGAGLAPVREQAQQQALRRTSQQFEAVFVTHLLKSMHGSTLQSGLFGQGVENDIYQSFMDQAVAEKVAARGGFGLGAMVERTLAARMEPQDGKPEAAAGPGAKPIPGRPPAALPMPAAPPIPAARTI